MAISWMPLPSDASQMVKLFNAGQSVKAWKKPSPSCPFPKIRVSSRLKVNTAYKQANTGLYLFKEKRKAQKQVNEMRNLREVMASIASTSEL